MRFTLHQEAFLPGFLCGLVDRIELEETAVIGTYLLLDMTGKPISRETEGAIRLSVYRDVIRAFQPDDISAMGFHGREAASIGIGEKFETDLLHGGPEGCDVFDLGVYGGEVGHSLGLLVCRVIIGLDLNLFTISEELSTEPKGFLLQDQVDGIDGLVGLGLVGSAGYLVCIELKIQTTDGDGFHGSDELTVQDGFSGSSHSQILADGFDTGFAWLLGLFIPTDHVTIRAAGDVAVSRAVTGNQMSAVVTAGTMFGGVGDVGGQVVAVAVVGIFIDQLNHFSAIILTIMVEVEAECDELIHVFTQATHRHVTGIRHRLV